MQLKYAFYNLDTLEEFNIFIMYEKHTSPIRRTLPCWQQKIQSISESQYREMLEYYQTIKHFFTLEGMTNEIVRLNLE